MKNDILESIEEAHKLSQAYNVPALDIILMGLNMEGIHTDMNASRVRFQMKPKLATEPYFFALTNTSASRWKHNGSISFQGEVIGEAGEPENDTCDNTYFRRFEKSRGTALTINSNSRSNCAGCLFCGSYNQDPEDAGDNDLTNWDKMRAKLYQIVESEHVEDFSHLYEAAIVTGCFKDEAAVLFHLLMLNQVLREEFGFMGELEYIGSQIRSHKALEELNNLAEPFAYSFTVECFDRRDQMLKPTKRIELREARDILGKAKVLGSKTTILYIMGLDPLNLFETEMEKFSPVLTHPPIVNTMQEYVEGQAELRHPDANNMEYYLKARQIYERIFGTTHPAPYVWENYRGLFFSEYNGERMNGYKI